MPNLSKPQKHNKLERRQRGIQREKRVLNVINSIRQSDHEYSMRWVEKREDNPRKMGGERTKQEILSEVDLKDQLEEIENPPI